MTGNGKQQKPIQFIMRKKILTIIASLATVFCSAAGQEDAILPDITYLFAQKDTCSLFMDIYEPSEESPATFHGKEKPTIIFMFGGGFIEGNRADTAYLQWYRNMADNGYRVIAIDYRLGLKGAQSVGVAQVNSLDDAIHMAVEDLYSAVLYIVDNAETMGIDPANIVISGSSAGAISVLQADYELCNRTEYAACLPEDFRFAGVMAFSGAVLSRSGKLKYETAPAPTAFFHGTSDKLVNYGQIRFFNLGFFGSDKIAKRFAKFGYNYSIFRFLGHGHEVANFMEITEELQLRFLEDNVIDGAMSIYDMTIDDTRIEKGSGVQSRKELYDR